MNSAERDLILPYIHDPDSYPYRVHGNGFVQVNLSDKTRLHIWDDRIPRQKVNTTVHNHRFAFDSTILFGCLIQVEVNVGKDNNDGLYEMYVAEKYEGGGEDTKLVPYGAHLGDLWTSYVNRTTRLRGGQTYSMLPTDYHITNWESLTVTVMTKGNEFAEYQPRVLCNYSQEPDNDFNRYDHANNPVVAQVLHDSDERLRSLFGVR